MKACPECGAELHNQDAVVCPACGKQLSNQHEAERPSDETVKGDAAPASPDRKKKNKWCRRKTSGKSRKKKAPASEGSDKTVDDGYDGYYNDVLPPDLDRIKEGPDKELIKQIVILGVAVVIIISFCVAMMYML